MKERPILFSGSMVRAILDGSKTQTRRIVKQPIEGRRFGDRVWPAFTKPHVIDGFEAIGVDAVNNGGLGLIKKPYCVPGDLLWASRITLEVTDVRVERLNDISVVDAMCEGIPVPEEFLGVSPDGMPIENPDADGYHPVDAFRELWESINGKGSFDSRWVWAVTFKRLEATS